MRLFKHVVLETNSFCNRKCIFCPKCKDPNNNKKIELSMETIHKIIQELKELGFDKRNDTRIELALYNEPTYDKRLPEIIKYIRNELPSVHMFFNTNGDFFNKSEQYIELFDSGLNSIEINIYDEDRRDFLENIHAEVINHFGEDRFQNSFLGKSKYNIVTDKVNGGKFRFIVVDKTKYNDLKSIHKIRNKAGELDWMVPKLKEPIKMVCGFPFRYFVIRADGYVNLCCDDYYNRITYGNMNDHDVHIKDIWYGKTKFNINFENDGRIKEGETIEYIRRRLLNRDRNFYPCDVCDNRITFRPHIIYDHWQELVDDKDIIEKINKRKSIKKVPKKTNLKDIKNREINSVTGKPYSDALYAILTVLREADGKILIEDAIDKLLEINSLDSIYPRERARTLFTTVASKYGVPVGIKRDNKKTYVYLNTKNNKSLFED